MGDQVITLYPEIDKLLRHLLGQIQQSLGEKLVALYLYGSLVTGDFDKGISDIDLLAAIASELEPQEFEQLQQMHYEVVAKNPEWNDRLEIAYLSVSALQTFRTQVSPIAVISPGEPFHFKEAGKDWLINWWVVREKGVTLFGLPPTALIEPISREEFLQTVQEHSQAWGEWVNQMEDLPGQAYAILTLCRALYAAKNGEQVSKKEAALWAQVSYPQWASLIKKALAWRTGGQDEAVEPAATFPETVGFVHFVIEQIIKKPEGGNRDEGS